MKVISSALEMKALLKNKKSIGFVPTMGAIHEGHLALVKASQKDCDLTVVSLFLNATQFNNKTDLETYPSSLTEDLQKMEIAGVDVVFTPTFEEVYPDNFNYQVDEKNLSRDLCGSDRPGHFTGVLTVVMKLFNIVDPSYAYFGEKDFQQLKLIEGMVDAFFMNVKIVPVPTVRDQHGLAMSSRNRKLDGEGLMKARFFADKIKGRENVEKIMFELEKNGIEVDYLEDRDRRRFAAVKINNIRLIDNVEI